MIQSTIFKFLVFLTWNHPSTHPPTHQTIHPAMGGEVSTDFKSLNRIEISQLVSSAIEFWLILGVPFGGWGVGGCGWGVVIGYPPPTCTHKGTWHHREFPRIPKIGMAICMKLSCLSCIHVHVCGGHPPTTPHPIHPKSEKLQ